MKARLVSIYLLSVTLFTLRGFAQAAPEADKPDGSSHREKRRQEILARYDKNGDGKLDAEEKAAMKADQVSQGDVWKPGSENPPRPAGPMPGPGAGAGMQAELLKRFDKDGDGKLNAAEQAEADKFREAAMKQRAAGGPNSETARYREELLKRFDHNGDGKLDEAERAEAEKARQQMEQNGGVGRFRAQVLKMFDKDGDGVLNEAERAEAEKFRLEQVKRFDKDGDGQLNPEERAEALKAFVAEHPDMAPPAK